MVRRGDARRGGLRLAPVFVFSGLAYADRCASASGGPSRAKLRMATSIGNWFWRNALTKFGYFVECAEVHRRVFTLLTNLKAIVWPNAFFVYI